MNCINKTVAVSRGLLSQQVCVYLPKNVEQMYSDIWLPDLLDSEKWESSLFNILLNCNENETV